MKTIIVICSVVFFCVFETIQARPKGNQSKPLVIDLAESDPGTIISFPKIKNQKYDLVQLKNAVVGYKYNVEIERVRAELPELSFSVFKEQSGITTESDRAPEVCPELKAAIKAVDSAYDDGYRKRYLKNNNKELDEKALSKRINELQAELDKNNCNNIPLIQLANASIEQSNRYFYQNVSVEAGETVTITIQRDSLTWTYILKGESLGQWVTSYGFGFTSNSLGGNTYFAKQMPDTSIYKILKSKNAGSLDLNYIPAVFFSFYPSRNLNRCWNHSLTAGLGFDLSAPVVFFGYNGMFWQNLGFSVGVAFQQQYKLKDQYSENDILYNPLQQDQLHDQVYRPTLFLAVNFRFGENPFEKNDKKTP